MIKSGDDYFEESVVVGGDGIQRPVIRVQMFDHDPNTSGDMVYATKIPWIRVGDGPWADAQLVPLMISELQSAVARPSVKCRLRSFLDNLWQVARL